MRAEAWVRGAVPAGVRRLEDLYLIILVGVVRRHHSPPVNGYARRG